MHNMPDDSGPFGQLFHIKRLCTDFRDHFYRHKSAQKYFKRKDCFDFYRLTARQRYRKLLYVIGKTAVHLFRHIRIFYQPRKRDHSLPAAVRLRIVPPQIQEGQMQNPLYTYSFCRMLLALQLNAALTVKDLQDIFFEFGKGEPFRHFAFGLILHQQFFEHCPLRVKDTLLLERIYIT